MSTSPGEPSRTLDDRTGHSTEHTEPGVREAERRDRDRDERDDSPSLRQRLHAATGDRDREAEALADRSPDDVSVDDAKVAVNRAHGHDPEVRPTESEIASPEDAEQVADERDD
ncbi:hypothetical protein [Dermatobacter hominis]|uniref:hypothetical protein n=1 Tax=Dermatobacter hominis TaxID=2884263 RepID=UPI001D10F4B1|nr:hypothetical protein [Dermatobacter hominis]UDY37906.1 hypothetical protein LH044_10260 [Dermatobacter hominis]